MHRFHLHWAFSESKNHFCNKIMRSRSVRNLHHPYTEINSVEMKDMGKID